MSVMRSGVQPPFSAAIPSQVAERINRLGSANVFIRVGVKRLGILGASLSVLLGQKQSKCLRFLCGEQPSIADDAGYLILDKLWIVTF
jgi:glutathione S-transferase